MPKLLPDTLEYGHIPSESPGQGHALFSPPQSSVTSAQISPLPASSGPSDPPGHGSVYSEPPGWAVFSESQNIIKTHVQSIFQLTLQRKIYSHSSVTQYISNKAMRESSFQLYLKQDG